MLRRRVAFKPNVAPNNNTNLNQIPSPVQEKQAPVEELQLQTLEHSNSLPNLSDQRVKEAITQLTSQKFEPIKLPSLISSANRNVKLKDLLFFNPPMTKDQRRHKKSLSLAKKKEKSKKNDQNTDESESCTNDDSITPSEIDLNQDEGSELSSSQKSTDTSDFKEPSLVPKVKMGPEGRLILDESSTIINRKNSIREQEAIFEDHEDVISRTNYDSYRRRPASTNQTKWSQDDTKKFYQALTIFGTDFSMMESFLFEGLRNRTELHKKFKREERMNKVKVDIALSKRISLTSDELDDLKEVFLK